MNWRPFFEVRGGREKGEWEIGDWERERVEEESSFEPRPPFSRSPTLSLSPSPFCLLPSPFPLPPSPFPIPYSPSLAYHDYTRPSMDSKISLLKKADQLLQRQQGSFSTIDNWIRKDRSVPQNIRQDWNRICRLRDFLKDEVFKDLPADPALIQDSKAAIESLRFLTNLLRFLEDGPASLQAVLDHLTKSLKADRGIFISCSEQSSQVRVLAASNLSEPNLTLEEFHVSRTVFRQILQLRQSVLICNPLEDPAYAAQSSIYEASIRSILAAPILGHKEVIGIIYFDTRRLQSGFTDSDLANLEQVRPLLKSLFLARFMEQAEPVSKSVLFLDHKKATHGLIGADPEFLAAVALVKKVAPTPAPVLLTGESGTGKELFARAVHVLSSRKDCPFVAINCAAIPDALLESELFGYEKGAFTGADALKIGKIERANHGTLFLDEIGEMKLDLQVKLLRFLQSQEIERVGGRSPIRVDLRIIAATNRDLIRSVEDGSFRQDLYFRINVFPILLPPLRKRRSDIRSLAEHFLTKYAELLHLSHLEVDPAVYAALLGYDFPGNIRELENIVYRSLVLARSGRVTLDCLPDELQPGTVHDLQKNPFWHLLKAVPESYDELNRRKEEMKQICRREIARLGQQFAEAAVAAAGGNISKASQTVGIDRGQFHRLLKGEL
ncbi:MAG TPA: sigma 54-interacting transcriptional regulator [Acidobacteriota bacterium]|nr:sigma 54-interacting transcriptional regulator [Acidobacteriota bacterium]